MARLPDIPYRPVNGEAPSMAVVRPTDLGLGEAAQSLSEWGRAREETAALQAKVQRQEDDKAARPLLEELAAGFERKTAEAGERYDGAQPGFAKSTIDSFEADAQPLLSRTDLAPGVQAALRRGYDRLRVSVGQGAIDFEAKKAARRVAEQEAARKSAQEGHALAGYLQAYATAAKPIDDSYDGRQPAEGFVAAHLQAHDQAAKATLDATPEADRPGLQMRLDAERLKIAAGSLDTAEKGQAAYVADAARDTGAMLANAIRTKPSLFDGAEDRINAAVAALPPEIRRDQARKLRGEAAAARVEGLVGAGQHELALKELEGGRLDTWLEPGAKDRLLDAVKGDAAKRASDKLEAMTWGGGVDTDALTREAQVSGDEGLQAKAEYAKAYGLAEHDPFGGAAVGAGFKGAADYVLGLEGGYVENDNGHGPSNFGINARAHPGVDIKGLTREKALEIYRREYWQATGADQLAPPMALAVFDTAVNMGPDTAKSLLARSGGDPATFFALREKRYREIAAQPGQGQNLKIWLDRTAKVRAESARLGAWAAAQEGVSSDPIKFAMGTNKRRPLAQVPGLPASPAEPGWGEALRGRLAVGQAMNRNYRAPLRLLTDNEAAYYRDQMQRDPGAGVALAEQALASIGPAATRSLMGELGKADAASVQLHIADLRAAGLTGFAQSAVTGLALKGQGRDLDKELKGDIDAAVERHKALFAGRPETLQVVREAAYAAALGQSATGTALSGAANVNSAMGGVSRNGQVYGGVASVNGAAVLLPSWLAADRGDDVLAFLAQGWGGAAQGPVWSNGREIGAREISQMRLAQTPGGRYRLVDRHGAAMLAKGGGAFEFDLDAAAPILRKHFGAAVVQDFH